jgi:hypothetical protein
MVSGSDKNNSSARSIISNLGNIGIKVGDKIGKVITEFFIGKQPSPEERERIKLKRERAKLLKKVQEDAEYERDLRLAERGEYIPPKSPEKKTNKNDVGSIFSNLGKKNPLEGFGSGASPDFGIGGFGSKDSSVQDFGLEGFIGTKNPMENTRKYRRS